MKITVFDYREMIPFEIKEHWGILWNPATEWKTHLLGYWYLKYLFFFKYVNLCALPQEEFPRESVPFLFLGLEVSSGRKWALLLVIQNVIASYDITWHLWATLATPLVRLIRREVDNGWISLPFSPRFSRTFRLTLVWNCEWMFVLRVSERGRIRTDWYTYAWILIARYLLPPSCFQSFLALIQVINRNKPITVLVLRKYKPRHRCNSQQYLHDFTL